MIAIYYNIPTGNTAAYYPESNGLVPVASVAYISNTPTSRFGIVTVVPVAKAFVKGAGSTGDNEVL